MEWLLRPSKDVQITLIRHTTREVIHASQRNASVGEDGPFQGVHVEHMCLTYKLCVHVRENLNAKSATTYEHEQVARLQEVQSMLIACLRLWPSRLHDGPGVFTATY